MSTTTTSLVVLAFVFGGALVGIFLRRVLPQQHLSDASKDIVRVGIGMVVTITALVLSLLIASAKAYYDRRATNSQRCPPRSSCWTAFWPTTDLRRRKPGTLSTSTWL